MPHEPLNILVVDDDPIYAHFVASTLTDAGHHLNVARDAAAAIEQARAESPSVVILDIRLPDESGYSVALRLRREVLPSSAVIIMLTAEIHPQLDAAHAADVDLVLTKPLDAELVRNLVDHVRQRRQLRLQRLR